MDSSTKAGRAFRVSGRAVCSHVPMDSGAGPLLSLTYVSSATELLDLAELSAMLTRFRPRNEDREITGLLLYSGGNIIQTLEGPDRSVDATYAEICADPRHTGLRVLVREEVGERSFADWAMGFRHLAPEDRDRVDGYSDFLEHSDGSDLDEHPGASLRMLQVFRQHMR